MSTEYKSATLESADEDDHGQIKAVFSTFDVADHDLDIVRKSAFTDGQPIPLCWNHDWSRPIGKGQIRVEPSRAVFDGSFFMQTADGKNAYEICKAMSDLQEFSYGFRVVDSNAIRHEGRAAREITKINVFEVSAVLKGASLGTQILALKGQTRLPLNDQGDQILTDLQAYVDRLEERAGIRAKEGRRLSTQTRDLIAAVLEAIDTLGPARERLSALYDESAPRSSDSDDESGETGKAGTLRRDRVLADYLAMEARRLGVQV